MKKSTFSTRMKGLIFGVLTTMLLGCTTTDPYTGQQRIDYGATAGVAGLALGAAALGVAADRDNRRDVVIVDRHPGYRPYRPYRPAPPIRPLPPPHLPPHHRPHHPRPHHR